MVTMVDELFDRTYQTGRAQLNAGIASAVRAFGQALRNAFVVLNRPADSDPANTGSWGLGAVVCDPWSGDSYPATEAPRRLTSFWGRGYKPRLEYRFPENSS